MSAAASCSCDWRWNRDIGLGSLMPTMIPYSIWLFISRQVLTVLWVSTGFDLGPGASVSYTLPG